MNLQATIRDAQGNQGQTTVPVDDTATKGQVLAQLRARGYEVVNLERLPDAPPTPAAAAPTPEAPSSFGATVTRALPMMAGMARGAAMGSRFGWPGAVAGAGLGAAGAEGMFAGAQRLFGVGPESEQQRSIPDRMLRAGETGALTEAGGRAVGAGVRAVGGKAMSLLGKLGPKAESGFGGLRDAGVTQSIMQEIEARGGAVDAMTYARKIRPALRRSLADVERTQKALQGGGAQRTSLQATRNSLRDLVQRTASLAPIAHALAKDPVLLADLVGRAGPEMLPELQGAWLSSAFAHATTKAGKGLLNTEALTTAFNELGETGQQALFAERAPAIKRLFDVIGATEPVVGSETVKAATGSALPKAVGALLGGTEMLMGGHPLIGGGIAAAPWVIGRMLARPGGAEWLTQVAGTMRDARLFQSQAPALAKAGLRILGATMAENAPAAPRAGRLGLLGPAAAQ